MCFLSLLCSISYQFQDVQIYMTVLFANTLILHLVAIGEVKNGCNAVLNVNKSFNTFLEFKMSMCQSYLHSKLIQWKIHISDNRLAQGNCTKVHFVFVQNMLLLISKTRQQNSFINTFKHIKQRDTFETKILF